MKKIQLIEIEPSQLVDLIKDGIKTELQTIAIKRYISITKNW